MKINDIIRERRLKKGLTQEQLAGLLGVSAPAVNKWEKGISYPDIVLLPPLARLLDTDLNTLLSFKDNLSEKEIAFFMNELSAVIEKDGFEMGYSLAIEKIKEYPSCDLLLGSLAMLLSGALMLKGSEELNKKYSEKLNELFQRAAKSGNIEVREQAQACLIAELSKRQEYAKAQEILDSMESKSIINKEQIQAKLLIAEGEYEKAERLMQERLLKLANEIQSALMILMEIKISEEKFEEAERIAGVCSRSAGLLELWEYNAYIAHYRLYIAEKNKEKTLKILPQMLKSLDKSWNTENSLLYSLIRTKESELGQRLKASLIKLMQSDENMKFLQNTPEFDEIIRESEK